MRHLTILRTKSFVGALASLKVYIEDPDTAELSINETPCRKLGVLKNGEAVTFEIGDGACKVFVIADAVSRNYCNDFYQIPEGTEDVSLSGRPRFNPANGNAFRFDNNDNYEAMANREKGSRKGRVIFIAAIVIGLIIGLVVGYFIVSAQKIKDKTFSEGSMSVTLTTEFKQESRDGYFVAFNSKNVGVLVLEEKFSDYEGLANRTLAEYENAVAANNAQLHPEKIVKDGRTCLRIENSGTDGKTYVFFLYAYKGKDAFFLFQFIVDKTNLDRYESKIPEWANSVRFDPA